MEKKIHAMFVDEDHKFLYYQEFTLGEEIEIEKEDDRSNEDKIYSDESKKYYNKAYERYWSSYLYPDWSEWYVYVSKNVKDLFGEWETWLVRSMF